LARAVTRDIYWREPKGMARVTRRGSGRTGLVVHGWYNHVYGWNSAVGWNAVTVRVDGTPLAVLHQFRNGPRWIDLPSGVHYVEFVGTRGLLHSEWIKLARGESVMIAFKPRARVPFRRATTEEQWSIRQLW
jgi:hypothetical protein